MHPLSQNLARAMAVGLMLSATTRADDLFETKSYEYTGGPYEKETFEYRLMRPANVEEGRKYPLVVFLHGAGERGDDNRNQLKYLPEHLAKEGPRRKYPCFVLAPQCRRDEKWSNVSWGANDPIPLPKEPSHQMRVAIAALERTLADEAVDPDRVYLTGLSMGGYGTWDLAARHPDWFAAAAPICGGGDPDTADRIAKLPIWAFHGDADNAVPVRRTLLMIDAIKAAGGEPRMTIYKGVGHNSWDRAYQQSELLDWMFAQRRKKD